MKTKDRKIKEFDTVETFRDIKTQISKEINGMTYQQLLAYLDKNKLKTQK
jgi:hypothetical protein